MQHEEDQHQIALMDWSEMYTINLPGSPADGHKIRDYLFAIPNGGKRYPREAKRLRSMGVTPGIMDLMLAIPTENFNGLFLEIKRPATKLHKRGSITKQQREKIELFREIGYKAEIAYGCKHATEWICNYLK